MRTFMPIVLLIAAFFAGTFPVRAAEEWRVSRGGNLIAVKAPGEALQVNLRLRDPANMKKSDNWLQLARPLSPEEGKHRFVTLQWSSTLPGRRYLTATVVGLGGALFSRTWKVALNDTASPLSFSFDGFKDRAGRTCPADFVANELRLVLPIRSEQSVTVTDFTVFTPEKPAEFSPDGSSWSLKHGGRGFCEMQWQPQGRETVFSCRKKNPLNHRGSEEWVLAECPVGESGLSDCDGVELQVKRGIPQNTYFEIRAVEESGRTFVMAQHVALSPEYRVLRFPFRRMKSVKEPKAKVAPEKVRKIALVFVLNATDSLSLRGIRRWKEAEQKKKSTETLQILPECGNTAGLFEPDQECVLRLQGGLPDEVASARCSIRNYFGEEVFSGVLKRADSRLNPGKLPPGYYEVRIFPALPDGTFSRESCIRTNGWENISGMVSFAVMPCRKEENLRRMRQYGMAGFYGIMNSRHQFEAHERMGTPWALEGPRWIWCENKGPGPVIDGVSEWAARKMKQPKRPDYLFSLLALSHKDRDIPPWARGKYDFRSFANGKVDSPEYLQFIRSAVLLHKYQYSHMRKRIYEITWEPDLDCRPGGATIHDVLAYYKRVVPLIRSLDPDALIYGPKATLNLPWIRKLFEAGLGEYLDGVSGHFYTTPLPEDGGLPEKFAEYRALVKKFTGREMRLCNTEGGYYSKVLGVNDLTEQARRDLRYALISQGEGLDLLLLFYLFDFSGEKYTTWGMFFTDRKNGDFSPRRLMPKPVVPAYAVAASLLCGARPVMHLRWIDPEVWGYLFQRDGEPVIALWNPRRSQKIHFPAGARDEIVKVDIMGRRCRLPVKDGMVTLTLSPDVTWLLGMDPDVWLGEISGKTADNGVQPLELYCGRSIALPGRVERISAEGAENALDLSGSEGVFRIAVAENALPGVVPLRVTEQGRTRIQFARINPPLELGNGSLREENGMVSLYFPVRNNSASPVGAELALTSPAGVYRESRSFPAASRGEVRIPAFRSADNPDPLAPFAGTLRVTTANYDFVKPFSFTFLAAWERTRKTPGELYRNSVVLKGEGASGKIDSCRLTFFRDREALTLCAELADDQFHQEKRDDSIWMQDSIQVAFDTDPHNVYEYDELTARLSKKVTSIGAALTPEGVRVYRYLTFQERVLPTGDITGKVECSIRREGGKTFYRLRVPWRQIGLAPEEAVAGKELGISVLVNDSDGAKSPRRTLSLFGGIADGSGWRYYGVLNLR